MNQRAEMRPISVVLVETLLRIAERAERAGHAPPWLHVDGALPVPLGNHLRAAVRAMAAAEPPDVEQIARASLKQLERAHLVFGVLA